MIWIIKDKSIDKEKIKRRRQVKERWKMNSLRKLAEDYYNFILKYDECFYKKYQKEELLKVKTLLMKC